MKAKQRIEKLLIKTPHLKDSDNKLIATIWFREIEAKGLDPKNIRSEHYHCINCNKGGSLFPNELIDFFSIPKGN